MRIREALAGAGAVLRAAGVDAASHDAETLLAHELGVDRGRLAFLDELTPDQVIRFDALIARRAGREPLQHITGRAPFRYVEVEVGPGVFVPRPETEVLTGWVVDQVRTLQHSGLREPLVVELCAGSAAVALSVATEAPGAVVHAVELAEPAVAYAARNLAGSGVHLHCGDITDALHELDGAVDVVVANPPYIPLHAFESVQAEARDFDPPTALWSGDDGLDAIRLVERCAARLLHAGGVVGCEHADVQWQAAPAVFAGTDAWADIRDRQDLAGKPRFVTARRAGEAA
jgi:release factor glutamine methyltransferase